MVFVKNNRLNQWLKLLKALNSPFLDWIIRSYLKKIIEQFFIWKWVLIIYINFRVEWYKEKIPAVKPWQISVDYTSEYLIKPEVPQRMIDEFPNNQTRIIMMVCDPIERAELEFFEIFNNLDTNHADWKAKIDAVGDIVSKIWFSFFILIFR